MQKTLLSVPLLLILAVGSAHAQYVEIYRLDNLTKELSEQQVLAGMATHLGMSADMLSQQKAEYKLSFGELYFANQLAKVSKTDFKSLMAEAKGAAKTWGVIAKEKNADMGQISKDSHQLEDLLKKAKRSN
jgi:hypothetical protein